MTAFRLLPLAALLLSVPAAAQGDDAPAWIEVDGWMVFPAGDEACQAVADSGYGTVISISEDSAGNGRFILSDDYLTLKSGDIHPASISWDGWAHSQDIEFAVAPLNSGALALRAETGPWFTENLAETKRFAIRVPGMEYEQDFPIDNALDMINAIHFCNDQL